MKHIVIHSQTVRSEQNISCTHHNFIKKTHSLSIKTKNTFNLYVQNSSCTHNLPMHIPSFKPFSLHWGNEDTHMKMTCMNIYLQECQSCKTAHILFEEISFSRRIHQRQLQHKIGTRSCINPVHNCLCQSPRNTCSPS